MSVKGKNCGIVVAKKIVKHVIQDVRRKRQTQEQPREAHCSKSRPTFIAEF